MAYDPFLFPLQELYDAVEELSQHRFQRMIGSNGVVTSTVRRFQLLYADPLIWFMHIGSKQRAFHVDSHATACLAPRACSSRLSSTTPNRRGRGRKYWSPTTTYPCHRFRCASATGRTCATYRRLRRMSYLLQHPHRSKNYWLCTCVLHAMVRSDVPLQVVKTDHLQYYWGDNSWSKVSHGDNPLVLFQVK